MTQTTTVTTSTTNDTRPRTALVTGGSRGLGRALTEHLVQTGWWVLTDGRDPDTLERARAGTAHPDRVRAIAGDIADPGHRAELAAAVADVGGGAGLDLLVHNASLLGPSPQPALVDYPHDALAEVYLVNVLAPLALTQLLVPTLRARGGRIIHLSSDAAVEPYEGWGGYGSSKAALDQLSAILGAELTDLRVYAVDPGDMRTDMHQSAFPGEDISDRPEPATVVPALTRLIDGELPSGRYRASELADAPLLTAS